ncbi:MAG: DNA double-strand break repair nuclease NurA [Candidatus Wukongarchaeota archaeon]|jgi:hypothetical protein|nr:DNA double-strand break repair nuclease NurA [Candidatus Wukongarchaeota archaeon]MDO8128197.1 DNA double-strand break repair nuclease NurA [Candidatus Wukongarchaeota archaeon]
MSLSEIVTELISKGEEIAEEVIKQMKKAKEIVQEIKGNELPSSNKDFSLNELEVGAVDGGMGKVELTATTIILIKSFGGIFNQNSTPKWIKRAHIEAITLSRNIDNYVRLLREILEIETAIELAKKNIDYLLLDGSLATLAERGIPWAFLAPLQRKGEIDLTENKKKFIIPYKRFIKSLDRLFKTCESRNTLLIGVSKDSRAKYLKINDEIPSFTDSALVSLALKDKTGFIGPIKVSIKRDPGITDLLRNEKVLLNRDKFFTFYVKLKPHAKPFRFDLLPNSEQRTEDALKLFLALEDGHGFILPPHFVHNQATVSQEEISLVTENIKHQILAKAPIAYNLLLSPRRRDFFG